MKRLVSYIYKYEKGKKGENTGFGKIDTDDNRVKINLSLRCDDNKEHLGVYFFVREKITTLIFVGNAVHRNNTYELKTIVDINDITEGKYSTRDIYGIIIKDERDIRFISFWREEYQVSDCMNWNEVVAQNIEGKSSEKSESMEDSIEVIEEDTVYLVDRSCVPVEDNNKIMCEEIEESINEEIKQISEKKINSDCILEKYYSKDRIYEAKVDNSNHRLCKIMPKDIYVFPKESWSVLRNGYLCHGFMKYGSIYIIEEDGIYIGVPGYKTINDEILAGKYGFNRFMECELDCLKVSSNKMWIRGLWSRKIM